VLPRAQWASSFFAPQPPPGRAARHEAAPPRQQPTTASPAQANPHQLTEPVKYLDTPAQIVDTAKLLDAGHDVGVDGGTGDPTVPLSPAIRPTVVAVPSPPPRVQPQPAAAPEPPVRYTVGGLVTPPKALHTPRPVYPLAARLARISGVVRLEAIINTDGSIRSVHALQGHPFLVSAAMDAVRDWRYTPPMLNGNPIEVVMQIDVSFVLGR
jgi:periplasmic protein TonB